MVDFYWYLINIKSAPCHEDVVANKELVVKRSEINGYLQRAVDFCIELNFYLPKWAFWSPEDWAQVGHEADEVRERMLGWDVTDFGSNNFEKIGLLLFTIRNGLLTATKDPFVKDYAEKMLLVGEGQVTPTHFHWNKMEDIINRGGGDLVLVLNNTDRSTVVIDRKNPVCVSVDGIRRTVPAGGSVTLLPGESITLPPYCYHSFYGEPGRGTVLCGEVSRVNDDAKDNRFLDQLPRFPKIKEDVPPRFLLCKEYPAAK